ncbi:MAG: NADH-quinone oxidoreductase subunit L, partial [Ktedonobacterales bacterium]
MFPVNYVWLVPVLPLAAVVLILFVTRPLDLLSKREPHPVAETVQPGAEHAASQAQSSATGRFLGQPGDPGAPEGPEGAADIDTTMGAHGVGGALEHDSHDAEAHAHDDHAGGHGEHGGSTSLWAAVSGIVGIVALAAAFVLSLAILIQYVGSASLQKNGYFLHIYNWFNLGGLNYTIDFRVDTLTCIMLVVVTGVSFLVHLYSVGYMAGDQGYARFYIELALFTFSMLILVLAANFLVLFIGWELVGLSSYLLIGFWYYHAPPEPGSEVPYPPPAALKAFVTTRLGDFGFLIGILILFTTTGTFQFTTLNTATTHVDQATITLAMILVFCGAVGKSAQFPLHVWLPDAMAGPTPVSALIHAATMVAAGVYLVARLFPIYAAVAGPQSLLVVGYVGAFTALFAATIALTQNDIKGVLAYSTISQLGYMFAGLAMADTNSVGIYHLFTHAFFKALLFLGSGSVIHAIANQDMRKMGGLARFMPITALTFLVATLAISGIPPFSGFWSKDPIIGAAFDRGNYLIYGMTLFTGFLTAFYMFRLFFMTFGGRGGAYAGLWGGREQYRGEAHPHESPWVMWLPLAILAAVTVVVGIVSIPQLGNLNVGFATFLNCGAPLTYYHGP